MGLLCHGDGRRHRLDCFFTGCVYVVALECRVAVGCAVYRIVNGMSDFVGYYGVGIASGSEVNVLSLDGCVGIDGSRERGVVSGLQARSIDAIVGAHGGGYLLEAGGALRHAWLGH